jgi:hypothetical protein
MRIEEAQWIGAGLARHVLRAVDAAGAVALNLGSGTRKAREVSKPYIDELALAPLRRSGWRVVHSDMFEGDGIDLVGDLFDPAFQDRLNDLRPQVVMFCNVFEHLPARLRVQCPAVLQRILAPGGYLFITVPRSYPYHADPIDTMYRPTPQQVAALFPGMLVLDAQVLDSDSYGDEFMRGSLWQRVRKLLRLLFPFIRPKRWLSHAHRFRWLDKPYRHSCLLLRKPADVKSEA